MILFLRKFSFMFLIACNLFIEGFAHDYCPELTFDDNKENIHAIWSVKNGLHDAVQTSSSSNYGLTWTNPISTPSDVGSPNLSNSGEAAVGPNIAANSTGQYVYAIWRRYDGLHYIIQMARSYDFGQNWINPTSTTGNEGSPNLSDSGQTAYDPQIQTDSTGQYVYAIWRRKNNINYLVQVAISSDYGANWTDPTTTTSDLGSPNLSNSGRTTFFPNLTVDSTGQYVYAIWARHNGSKIVVQTVKSSDYGVNWEKPTTTTGDETPNLSTSEENAYIPEIITNSTGQYIYAIWQEDEVIQTVKSSDYGVNWENSTSTPSNEDPPNLSDTREDAQYGYIIADSTGQNAYAIWNIINYPNDIIQRANSSDYGVNWDNAITKRLNIKENVDLPKGPTINTELTKKYAFALWFDEYGENHLGLTSNDIIFDGTYLQCNYRRSSLKSIFANEYVNEIYWDPVEGAQLYRVYLDSTDNMVYEGPDLEYSHYGIMLTDSKTYFVTWLDSELVESRSSEITIP